MNLDRNCLQLLDCAPSPNIASKPQSLTPNQLIELGYKPHPFYKMAWSNGTQTVYPKVA